MNRLKQTTVAFLLLACASLVRAQQVLTVENKWNEKTTAISTTGVTSLFFDISGFGTTGYAILGGTYTANGADGLAFGTQVAITTTNYNLLTSVGFDYTILSLGATAQLQISQTIKTPTPPGIGVRNANALVTSTSAFGGAFGSPFPQGYLFTTPVISSSAFITIPANTLYYQTFRGQVQNPIFNFKNLTNTATLYFQVNYGVPHLQ